MEEVIWIPLLVYVLVAADICLVVAPLAARGAERKALEHYQRLDESLSAPGLSPTVMETNRKSAETTYKEALAEHRQTGIFWPLVVIVILVIVAAVIIMAVILIMYAVSTLLIGKIARAAGR